MVAKNTTTLRIHQILSIIFEADTPLSQIEILRKTHIPKTTLIRILYELEEINYIKRDSQKRYSLGNSLLQFSSGIFDSLQLQKYSKPHLDALSLDINETVKLSVLFEMKAQVILVSPGKGNMNINVKKGSYFPLHAGAASKILLAYQPSEYIEQYLSQSILDGFTEHTFRQKNSLKKELLKIKKNEISFDRQEYILGIEAVAIPLLMRNKILAAISIPTTQKIESKVEIIQKLYKTRDAIQESLLQVQQSKKY